MGEEKSVKLNCLDNVRRKKVDKRKVPDPATVTEGSESVKHLV